MFAQVEPRLTPPSAATLSSVCNIGDLQTKTGTAAGLYVCTATNTWSALPGSGGSGTPGGANTDVQFNDAGSFGGDAGLTYDKTTDLLAFVTAGGLSFAGSASPILVYGGDDGGGDTTLFVDNPVDGYVVLSLPSYTDIYTPSGFGINNAAATSFFAFDGTSQFNWTAPDIEVNSPHFREYQAVTSAVTGAHLAQFTIESFYNATDGDPILDGLTSLVISGSYGTTAAPVGVLNPVSKYITVTRSGEANNQWSGDYTDVSVQLGTGFTQTTAPTGGAWVSEGQIAGPIALQPLQINGAAYLINNFYNGSPSASLSNGVSITTLRTLASDAVHRAAASYPVDVGLIITGTSSAGTHSIGFTKGIQIGGTGGAYASEATTSAIGTALDIRDYWTAGINIHDTGDVTAPSLTFDTFLQTAEMASAPSAPSANGVRVYAIDNGSGKTQLCAIFNSGAAQCFASQP